jgi:hypothetical protein
MAAGQTRAFFALIVAVTFGVLQVLCACLPANAQPAVQDGLHAKTDVVQQTVTGPQSGTTFLISDMAEGHVPQDMPPGHCDPDPDSHDHVENCSHCDDTNILTASADLPNAMSVEFSSPQAVIMSTALPSPRRAGMAATNLGGLKWRDPPRPTPVALKTLALI